MYTLEGDYVDEWSRILPKSCSISHLTNLLSDVLFHHTITDLFSFQKYFKNAKFNIAPQLGSADSDIAKYEIGYFWTCIIISLLQILTQKPMNKPRSLNRIVEIICIN